MSGGDWLEDRLLTRALEGLDEEEEAELRALLNLDDADHGHYEEAAAWFWLGAGDAARPLPPDVARRLYHALEIAPRPESAGDRLHETRPPRSPPPDEDPGEPPRPNGRLAPPGLRGGATAVAAGLVLAIATALWWPGPQDAQVPTRAELAQARSELMEDAPDAVRVEWERGGTLEHQDISGYVVWSDERQRGFMTFRDIPPNDPSEYRYHAWLFAGDGSETEPVSVGVFNAPTDGDEVIVPIRNKLPIAQAEGFGITREPPGGAQYSDKDSLLLLAPSSGASGT